MNSYELLQKLTNGRCEIYLPKAQVAIDPMECDARIQWNSDKDDYMKTSLKMTPESLVVSLIQGAYEQGVREGKKHQIYEVKRALGLL